MKLKFSWLLFFIILFGMSAVSLMLIPFPINEEVNSYEYRTISKGDYNFQSLWFPSGSFNQKLYLNITLIEGKLTIRLLDDEQDYNFWMGLSYTPYWEVINITDVLTTIQINPPFQFSGRLMFYGEEDSIYQEEIYVSYFRYYTSYAVVFLGIAILLISYYFYRKYKIFKSR